jgi:SAM-dependent methyltransferase
MTSPRVGVTTSHRYHGDPGPAGRVGTLGDVTRWDDVAGRGTPDSYQARFDRLAAAGRPVHGEADLCERLMRPGARVLDAGCGTGRVAIELARRGYSVTGVDVDPRMLAKARSLSAGVDWQEADLADLADLALTEPFDLVVCAGNVIPLVAPGSEPAVLAGLASAVAVDGRLVTGFGLDAAHLPLPEAPFDLAQYDAWCAAAGLSLRERFSTWDGDSFDDSSADNDGYVVSVHARS